jgi:hypothetical protein
MKWPIPALSLMFVGGVVVGIVANPTEPLRASDRLAVYTVYEANVTDPEGYKNNFLVRHQSPKNRTSGARPQTRHFI